MPQWPWEHASGRAWRSQLHQLKLGLSEPVVEKPFVPVPPRELSVFDEQHPLPKDAVGIAMPDFWLAILLALSMADYSTRLWT